MAIVLQPDPSLKAGYARSAAESEYPGLWKGLVGAWAPSLGNPRNLASPHTLATISGVATWNGRISPIGMAIDANDTGVVDTGVPGITGSLPRSVLVYVYHDVGNADYSFGFGANSALSSWRLRLDTANDAQRLEMVNGFLTGTESILQKWSVISHSYSGGIFGNVILYINGKNDAISSSSGTSSTPTTSSGNIRLCTRVHETNGLDGGLACAMVWDRVLTPTEHALLGRDPLAPFRLKPLTIGYSPAEAPAATATKVFSIKQPDPSIKAGYARNAEESASPSLWRGMVGAWCPSLGNTGGTVYDLVGQCHWTCLSTNIIWRSDRLSIINKTAGIQDGVSFSTGSLNTNSRWTIIGDVNPVDCDIVHGGIFGVHNNATNSIGWRAPNGQQSFRNGTIARLYDWGTSTDVDNIRAVWSWRAIDGTIGRLGKNNEFNNTTTTPGTTDWSSLNRIGEQSGVLADIDIATLLVYDRYLSDAEIHSIVADPLAPFRLKPLTIGYSPAAPEAAYLPHYGWRRPIDSTLLRM